MQAGRLHVRDFQFSKTVLTLELQNKRYSYGCAGVGCVEVAPGPRISKPYPQVIKPYPRVSKPYPRIRDLRIWALACILLLRYVGDGEG